MRNHILSGLATFLLFTQGAKAQSRNDMYISNYTYDISTGKIGRILRTDGNAPGPLRLRGKNASELEIRNDTLFLTARGIRAQRRHIDFQIAENKNNAEHFRIVRDEFIRNQVIAHRGAWKAASLPENSLAALKQAVSLGCAGSEFDVHLSADSILYVNHDAHIQGLAIESTASSELDKIRLSNGEHFPRLEDYLKEGLRQNKTKLVLELKPSAISKTRGIELSHKVCELVKKLKAEGWVDYISFDYDICKELVRLAPYARVSYLRGDKTPEQMKADGLTGFDYHISLLKKNPHWISGARQLKLETNCWTVNEAEDMSWLLQQHIDYITTNEPELLLKKIR